MPIQSHSSGLLESCFGVVPFFGDPGTALLPAIIAVAVTLAALVLRPKELIRLCRRKPWIPWGVAVIAVAGYFGVKGLTSHWQTKQAQARILRASKVRPSIDWTRVALEYLQQEEQDWKQMWQAEREKRIALEAQVLQLRRALNPAASPAPTPENHRGSNQIKSATIFRGSPKREGYGGGGSPIELMPLWRFAEVSRQYLSSPIVVGDSVFGASCLLDPPSNYGAVFCLDAGTGNARWLTDIVKDPRTKKMIELRGFFSSPAVSADGKYLVIGQGRQLDLHCQLICLDAQSGELHWRVDTPWHIESSPAIEGDMVVVGVGAVEGPDFKSRGDPGYVLAVRISDGQELWKYAVNDPESSPVIQNGVVFIGSGLNGNAVAALRAASDGELAQKGLDRLAWRTPTPYPAVSPITLAEDLVLIGCGNANYVYANPDPQGAVLAMDRKTGAIQWQVELPDAVLGAIAVLDGKAVCPVRNGEIVVLDLAQSGRILWRQKVRDKTGLLAGPAFTGTHIYAVTRDGYLAVMDAANGKVLETHYLNARGKPGVLGLSTSSPFVAGGRLFVGSETGGLRCFVGKEVK